MKEGKPMSDQERMNECIRDIDEYFRKAQPDNDEYNKSLARPLREKWGMKVISMGFAWIVMELRRVCNETMLFGISSEKQAERADDMIMNSFMMNTAVMHNLLETFGPDASSWLATLIKTSTDEDVRALAAYMLAADAFAKPDFRDLLREALLHTEGVSCQMALSSLSRNSFLSDLTTK